MNFLNEETETVWREFVELLESMRIFLDRMNADVSLYNLEKLRERKHLRESNKQTKKSENESKNSCAKCGRDVTEICANENKKFSCFGCLISALKEKPLSQLPISPEAFFGSFLASVLYWQKEQERERKPKSTKSCSTLEEITSDGNLSIRDSTMQMICDICEILNVATVREREDSLPKQTVTSRGESGSSLKNLEDTDDELGWSSAMSSVSKQKGFRYEGKLWKHKSGESSKQGVESRGELTSEGDSEFEEALTCQLSHHHDLRVKPSVTCMGDLSRAASGKKNVSTLTPNNDIVPSWMGKLSDVIKSKVKQIKSKRRNKTNVKVFEQPFEKSETALKKRPGMLQFSITASTLVGVFDVTVVQYKKRRYLAKPPVNYEKGFHPALGSDSRSPPVLKYCQDQFLSEESLINSESESVETCSNFGDDEMGEFLEIYVQSKDNAPVSSPKSHLNDYLRNMEIKTGKTHFLEMHRSYPVYFVQEFVKKTQKPQQNRPENLSNDASEEEIFSLNSGEKQEKQIVLEGSSSDLVIYIQVEIEDDSRLNSNCLLFDFEKSSLGAQFKENDSQKGSSSREKAIRLNGEEHKGESLFSVWRAQETMQLSEVGDMGESLVAEEKEQEVNNNEETVKEKSVSFKKNLPETLDERKTQDRFLEEEKVMNTANILVIKNLKQSAPIWCHQIGKRWKSVFLSLRPKPEVSKEIVESINSNAGELRKALRLIREIENDIVDAQIDEAISVLPRLESELQKHLLTERDDSIGGNSDESSEYRFNHLLKLLSSLEDAVKASEHSSNKTELSSYDSSKIYDLLHALTDSIRELEEDLNATSLSQTLDIASRLDTAIREYESIVNKQPVDYLVPHERSRKRRKPKWNTAEEASVAEHLKNVRKKVFEMIEVETVGMEERVERDFDRLDRLEMENDEAMMFLETLLLKTQKRISEFQNLKTELKEMYSSINILYENFQKVLIQETEEEKEAEKLEGTLERNPEKISKKISSRISEINSGRNKEKTSDGPPDKLSVKSTERIPEAILEGGSERIPETASSIVPERISERTADVVPEKILEKNSGIILGRISEECSVKILEGTPNKVPEKTLERNPESSQERTSKRFLERSPDRLSVKCSERISEAIPEGGSERIPETAPNKLPEIISERTLERNTGTISGRISEESAEKIFEGTPNKVPEKISERSLKRTPEKISERISERIPERIQEEEMPKNSEAESPSAPEPSPPPPDQESIGQIVSSFINAVDYLKSKSTENKSQAKDVPPSQSSEKPEETEQLQNPRKSTPADPLSSTIKEFAVIGQNSLYLSWTEPEGSAEGSIIGYEIHVDGKLNQKVRNPQRLQAVLYSVDLSKKIQVHLYAVLENHPKVLLARMDLNGE